MINQKVPKYLFPEFQIRNIGHLRRVTPQLPDLISDFVKKESLFDMNNDTSSIRSFVSDMGFLGRHRGKRAMGIENAIRKVGNILKPKEANNLGYRQLDSKSTSLYLEIIENLIYLFETRGFYF